MSQLWLVVWLVCLSACGVGRQYWPSEQDMAAFEAAGPIEPELDLEQMLSGVPSPGPYKVVPGDVLEIRGAGGFLVPLAQGMSNSDIVQARVGTDGSVTLPLVGRLHVIPDGAGGKTLEQVENTIADAMWPTFLAQRPAIVAKVIEPMKRKVAVMGAVERPGVIELRSDQLSVFGALSEAGGIIRASNLKVGSKLIRIRKAGSDLGTAVLLPVKGLNVPFADIQLVGGETVEVERWDPELFTVVGLVMKPGAYEYAPGQKINLLQALAIAGGVDRVADPPYASIFRRTEQGSIVAATFGISGSDITRASGLEIRPGDIIAVEHTVGSWTRMLLSMALRAQINFFVDPLRPR